MAVTAALVFAGHNMLRYLVTQDGAAGTTLTITTDGSATPDLQTDSLAGPIKNLSKTFTAGYGNFASGVQTQAKARALWLSDFASANPSAPSGVTGGQVPTAVCRWVDRSGTTAAFLVDANVDGSGKPILSISAQAGAGTAYLDVMIPGAIGA